LEEHFMFDPAFTSILVILTGIIGGFPRQN
jgi:hypothetical protein